MTIRSIVGEPLAVHGLDSDKAATRDKVAALIASVVLLPDMADRIRTNSLAASASV